jgi:poly(ribitol-phosphate) beta-N-acetylglucosaminyltransferase
MHGTTKVTVVVATYNSSAGVHRNVDSLLAQTMCRGEYEVFYVDDGSTDNTPDLIERRIAGVPTFHVLRSTNSGWPGRPRNIGIEAATGDFIFFSDDDDWLEPDALSNLYDRALRDTADIVIGRVAGHGRNSHRDVTQVSLTNGDIRNPAHGQLLTAMTVHKLFRRSFLNAHRIRFAEGYVRLEDHMFTLQAMLRTQRVSVMHDRTVYHWTRNIDFGNNSYGRIDPYGYANSLATIFGIIRDEIHDPVNRRRFMLAWYRRKVLRHFPQRHFLDGPEDYAAGIVDANRKLVDEWIPPEYDAYLGFDCRVRAALLRRGDVDLLRRWGQYERSATVRSTIDTVEWDGQVLVVRARVQQLLAVPGRKPRPVAMLRRGGRVFRDLPAPFRDLPELAEILDVTNDLDASRSRVVVRRRQSTGDIYQPGTSVPIEVPIKAGRFTIAYDVTCRVDPMIADQGRPLLGTWDFLVSVSLCGLHADKRLGAGGNMGIALPKRCLGDSGLVARPLLTTYGNLSLQLKPATRPADRSTDRAGTRSRVAHTVRGLLRRARALPPRIRSAAARRVRRIRHIRRIGRIWRSRIRARGPGL